MSIAHRVSFSALVFIAMTLSLVAHDARAQCIITIEDIEGIGTPVPLSIVVTGTAMGCPGDLVLVTIPFLDPQTAAVVGGEWSVTITNTGNYQCDNPITVHVECFETPECHTTKAEPQLKCIECPVTFELSHEVGACDGGARLVTLTAEISPAVTYTVIYEWEFETGEPGFAREVLAGGLPITEPPYPYPTSETGVVYTAWVHMISPFKCVFPYTFTLDPSEYCECPRVVDLIPTPSSEIDDSGVWIIDGCVGDGASVDVTISGLLSPDSTGCAFTWTIDPDFLDDSSTKIEYTTSPTLNYQFIAPGLYNISVTAACPGYCHVSSSIKIRVWSCDCLSIEDVGIHVITLAGCADGVGQSVTATFAAITDPPGAPGTYSWSFPDGSPDTATGAMVTGIEFANPGATTAVLVFTESNCPPLTVTAPFIVQACDTDDGGGGGGKGGFCGGSIWCCILWALLLISLTAAILALASALCGNTTAWWAFGFAVAGVLVFGGLFARYCDVNLCAVLMSLALSPLAAFAFICGSNLVIPATCQSWLCAKSQIPGTNIELANLLIVDIVYFVVTSIICAIIELSS